MLPANRMEEKKRLSDAQRVGKQPKEKVKRVGAGVVRDRRGERGGEGQASEGAGAVAGRWACRSRVWASGAGRLRRKPQTSSRGLQQRIIAPPPEAPTTLPSSWPPRAIEKKKEILALDPRPLPSLLHIHCPSPSLASPNLIIRCARSAPVLVRARSLQAPTPERRPQGGRCF